MSTRNINQFGYVCDCGHGAEITDTAWISAGGPRRVACWKCERMNAWRRLNLSPPNVLTVESPFRNAVVGLLQDPFGTVLALAVIIAICAALLSGWLGRIMGAAAVMVSALPPHGFN